MFSDDYEALTRLQRERPELQERLRLAEAERDRARRWARLWKAAAQLGRLRERVNDKIARRWRPRGAGVE